MGGGFFAPRQGRGESKALYHFIRCDTASSQRLPMRALRRICAKSLPGIPTSNHTRAIRTMKLMRCVRPSPQCLRCEDLKGTDRWISEEGRRGWMNWLASPRLTGFPSRQSDPLMKVWLPPHSPVPLGFVSGSPTFSLRPEAIRRRGFKPSGTIDFGIVSRCATPFSERY